jgi:acetyl-CoA synthetase
VAVITADDQVRGGKQLPLKSIVDEALALGGCDDQQGRARLQAHRRRGAMVAGRDLWMHELLAGQSHDLRARVGRGRAPAVPALHLGLHRQAQGRAAFSTGGYLLHAALTTKWTFDLKADDVFWCTADIGWVTGHTYITYGPLAWAAPRSCSKACPPTRTPAASGR